MGAVGDEMDFDSTFCRVSVLLSLTLMVMGVEVRFFSS